MSRVRWTSQAQRDLSEIGTYIARDNPAAAHRWTARLRDRARRAALNPAAGRMVPERERPDLREVFVGSYRIVYRVRAERIDVLTVFEGHRSFPSDVPLGE
ncbi:MAG TPA: type II toxin-antitoxin system RelE/ParE family toxin [Thermoanaerobaculia bacterium]